MLYTDNFDINATSESQAIDELQRFRQPLDKGKIPRSLQSESALTGRDLDGMVQNGQLKNSGVRPRRDLCYGSGVERPGVVRPGSSALEVVLATVIHLGW